MRASYTSFAHVSVTSGMISSVVMLSKSAISGSVTLMWYQLEAKFACKPGQQPFSPPWISPAFLASLPHSRRWSTQVSSERACRLERAPVGPTIAVPRYVFLRTGLACLIGRALRRLLPSDL